MSNEKSVININIKSLVDKVIIINTSETNSPKEVAEQIHDELAKILSIATAATDSDQETAK